MMENLVSNPERLAVVAITRDEARLWLHGIGAEDLPEYVHPPLEVDHRHRRTGQNHHGHESAHRFPEYFEAVAEKIRNYDGILILGHGVGKSAYGALLGNYLEKKHPDVAGKILEIANIDLTRLSEGEIALYAREWFSKNYSKLVSWHERKPFKWI